MALSAIIFIPTIGKWCWWSAIFHKYFTLCGCNAKTKIIRFTKNYTIPNITSRLLIYTWIIFALLILTNITFPNTSLLFVAFCWRSYIGTLNLWIHWITLFIFIIAFTRIQNYFITNIARLNIPAFKVCTNAIPDSTLNLFICHTFIKT